MSKSPEKTEVTRGTDHQSSESEKNPKQVVAKLFDAFMKDFGNMSTMERMKRIGEILFVATVGRLFGKIPVKDKDTNIGKEDKAKIPETVKDQKTEEVNESDASFDELAKIPDIKKRVTKIAERMVQEGISGKHCWDWVDKVYKTAKVKRNVIFSSFNKYEGKDCGPHCADENQLNQMTPGDHIFVNNKNKYDTHGNHSVIFLGWTNHEEKIAKVASYPGTGSRPPIIQSRNLNKQPVTYIAKPVQL